MLAELAVAGVRSAVRLSVGSDVPWDPDEPLAVSQRHDRALEMMLGELVAWSEALRGVRAAAVAGRGRSAASPAPGGRRRDR